ncbi:terminase family protein [Patescibacteria group bacterium]|nr:terminase family protein [Patescibacteria group bacterium]
MSAKRKYFLPYQERWLKDKSRLKIWEKSRRIGATYVQAYEDVRDCAATPDLPVWFSSADESAAKEYILYCEQWVKVLDAAAHYLGEVIIDSEKDIKTFAIQFSNGARINALRSNPKSFRSKGGKVILDEFGFHDDADAMWKAAKPCITWGFPMRILSTHNGRNCRFFRMIEDVKQGRGGFVLHSTDIFRAVDEGLAEKIAGRPISRRERRQWLDDERAACQDEDTWLQEFCCQAVDEATAFLTYELIAACEASDCLKGDLPDGLYLGMDIGRKKDLTVIWLVELVGDVAWTRLIKIMEKAPFNAQREVLFALLPKVQRACIDSTGLGMQLAEEAQQVFGEYRVEAVNFTGPIKEDLAFGLRRRFDDRTVRIPVDREIREDLHSVRKITTAAGNIRFDAQRTDQGHADRFWALALANHAGSSSIMAACVGTDPKEKSTMTDYRPGLLSANGGMFGRFNRARRISKRKAA